VKELLSTMPSTHLEQKRTQDYSIAQVDACRTKLWSMENSRMKVEYCILMYIVIQQCIDNIKD